MDRPADRPPAGGPLAGRRVAVTRSAVESGRVAARLEALGAEIDVVPLIASAPPVDDGAALGAAMGAAVAGDLEWVVVTSPTAARRMLEALAGRRPTSRLCAVGPGTAEVLEAAGVGVDLVPARHVGEGIVEEFPPATQPSRVAVVRAAAARDVVPDGLAAKGWVVEIVESHRTVPAAVSPEARTALGTVDVVTLTSSSTATALADLAAAHPDLALPPVVCIGPETAATAAARGLVVLAVADPHSIDGLVDAVVGALGPAGTTPRPGEGGRGAGP